MSDEQQSEAGSDETAKVVNSDGTTNWKVVFDDPDQGVMRAVRAVQSTGQLRAVMASVAQLLFKRKRDAGPRAEFQAKIDDMLDAAEADGFDVVQGRILEFLDAIKTFRIEKAAEHAKNKETSQSIERRKSGKDGLLAALTGNPVYLAAGIGGVLAVLVVIAMLLIIPSGEPDDEEAQQDTTEETASQDTKPAAPKAKPRPERIPMHQAVAMKPVVSDVLVRGERRRLALVPLIPVGEDDSLTPICALIPWINEGILIRMKSAVQSGQNASDRLFNDIGAKIASDLNARGGVRISRLILVDLRKLPTKVISGANKGCTRVRVDLEN